MSFPILQAQAAGRARELHKWAVPGKGIFSVDRTAAGPMWLAVLFMALLSLVSARASADETNRVSRVIEVAGKVDYRRDITTNWVTLSVGIELLAGDQVRTGPDSRAALQLSDRSIVRLSENAVLVLEAPRGPEQRRFRLNAGRVFLFNRGKPSSLEFETPLASGAIRGTEFVLDAGADGGKTILDLVDGRVEMVALQGTRELTSGERITITPGQPLAVKPIPIAASLPPWAEHFPMVLVPSDLDWENGETNRIARSLELYLRGDPVTALAAIPADQTSGRATAIFRAALMASVGGTNVDVLATNGSDENTRMLKAVRRLMEIVRGGKPGELPAPQTATEWLVASWDHQFQLDPASALEDARRAVVLQPRSGLVWERVAELAFGLDRLAEARDAVERSLAIAPNLGPAHALRGFLLLEQGKSEDALSAFARSLELDPSSSSAWLGRGLCLTRLHRPEAHESLLRAAAMEPQLPAYRTPLARSFAGRGDREHAEKELRLARTLAPDDPSAWLYSALWHWQQNRPNEAVRDLERSLELNDDRAVFRSNDLLDRDRAIRSANLGAMYEEVGFSESALRLASRATVDAYTDFSGHLLLANLYRDREDPYSYDLRYETTRSSEQLLANLLAPAGAGNLSQVLDQQEHLHYTEPPEFGIGSRTDYRGNGDWSQRASIFGNEGPSSYAFDVDYRSLNGQQPNGQLDQRWLSLSWKINLSLQDQLYVQGGWLERRNGDVARQFDPSQADRTFSARESQRPGLVVGYHRAWSPEHHTLLLGSYFDDRLSTFDAQPSVLFVDQSPGFTTGVSTPGLFQQNFNSHYQLFSGEAQHVWTPDRHTVIAGARIQSGNVDTHATLMALPPPTTDQTLTTSFNRADVYLYDQWKLLDSLSVIGGLTYSRVEYPVNADVPPLATGTDTKEVLGPKVGAVWNPWSGGLLRAMYSRSIGGLYFDNSVRLEPTQLGGYNQAFRSLIPESVAGLVPGTEFNVVSIGYDHSWRDNIFAGVGFDWLNSDGQRWVGVLTNSTPLPLPDSPSQTGQSLKFHEEDFSVYAGWLLGDQFSVSARYQLSHAGLASRFPQIPPTAAGVDQLNQDVTAVLHHGQFDVQWQHPDGWFARWATDWYQQSNTGYFTDLPGDDFWQHSVFVGYRMPGRRLQVQAGVLNLLDTDYQLNPLNYLPELTRHRTFAASLRLNF